MLTPPTQHLKDKHLSTNLLLYGTFTLPMVSLRRELAFPRFQVSLQKLPLGLHTWSPRDPSFPFPQDVTAYWWDWGRNCWTQLLLCQGSANSSLWTKSSLPPGLVTTVVAKYSHTCFFTCCFHTSTTEASSCDRDHSQSLQSLKYLLSGPLQEKVG